MNAEKDKADISKYQLENAEYLKITSRVWRESNRLLVNAYAQKYRNSNRELVNANGSNWRKRNRHLVNAKKSKRILTQLNATPIWANDFFIKEIYHLAKLRKEVCGGDREVDHIVPIRSDFVCGLHWEGNMRVVPANVNRRKSNIYWPSMPQLNVQ